MTVNPPARVAVTIHSLLFVSSGDILRGPMAEAMLRQSLSHVSHTLSIGSAGLRAVEGRAVEPLVQVVAREFSVSLESHRARLLTDEMVRSADLIVVMDANDKAELLRRHPDAALKLSAFEIAAPSGHTAHEIRLCCELLRVFVRGQATSLFPGLNTNVHKSR